MHETASETWPHEEHDLTVFLSALGPDDIVAYPGAEWLDYSPRQVGAILASMAWTFAVNRPGPIDVTLAQADALIVEVRRGFEDAFKTTEAA
jgi:hypothetical protein